MYCPWQSSYSRGVGEGEIPNVLVPFSFCVMLAFFQLLTAPCLLHSLLFLSSEGGVGGGAGGIMLGSKCHFVNGGAGNQI